MSDLVPGVTAAALVGTAQLGQPAAPPDPIEPGEDDWPNGFAWRAQIIIPAGVVTEDVSDALLLFVLDLDERAEAEGAADLRFETEDEEALPYWLARLNGEQAFCLVLVPEVAAATATVIHAFTGAAEPGTQEDAAAAHAGYLVAWDESGFDLTGRQRSLTPTGTSETTLASGFPATDFNGSSDVLSSAAATPWLAGLAAMTIEAAVEMDTDGSGAAAMFRAGTPSSDTYYERHVMLQALPTTTAGKQRVANMVVLTTVGTTAYALGETDSAAAGSYHLAGVWSRPDAPVLYRDGVALSPSAAVGRDGSSMTWPDVDGMVVGSGFDGRLAGVRIAGEALSAAKLALHAKTLQRPAAVYGVGAWHGPDDEGAPPVVAVPATATVAATESVDVDVVDLSVGGTSLVSVTQGSRSGSAVEIVGGLARYTPGGTTAGTDSFTATVSDGVDTSVCRVDVTITGSTGESSSTTLPTPLRTINVTTQGQLDAAKAASIPGDHIVVQASGLNLGSITRSGSEAHPIVYRADTVLARTTGGNWQVNASDVIVNGFDNVNRSVAVGNSTQANRVKIWRCRWRDRALTTAIGLRLYAAADTDVAYCEWTNWGGRGISLDFNNGCRRPTVRRCYLHDTPAGDGSNAHEAIQAGFGYADRWLSSGALLLENLIVNWDTDDECVSIKTSDAIVRRLRFIGNHGRLSNRLGWNNLYDAILFAGSAGIRIHDKGCEVLGCDVSGASQGLRIATGNFPVENTMTTSSSPSHPNAKNTYVGGCTGTLTIAHAFSGQTIKADSTTVREHSGSVSLVGGTHEGTDSAPGSPATGKSWSALWYGTALDVGPLGS